MLKVSINEYYGMVSLTKCDDMPVVIRDRGFFYASDATTLPVYDHRLVTHADYHHDAVWVCNDNNEYWYQTEHPAVIKNLNEPLLSYSQGCLVGTYLYSEKYVAAIVETEFMEYQLELYSCADNKAINIESECCPKLFFDTNLICEDSSNKDIVCFNDQLQEQWRFDLDDYKSSGYGGIKKIFAYQQLVIFLAGQYQCSKQSCIFALDAQTGVERWRFEFATFIGGPVDNDVTYCTLLDSYLAVSNKKQILLLNPETGELISTIKVSRVVPTVCQQLDNKLIVALGQTAKFEVYDIESGKKVSTFEISDKYIFNHTRLVIKENNKLYFSMWRANHQFSHAGEALAVVELEGDNLVINEPALDYQIEELRDKKRNLSHLFHVNESDLGRIQRLLAIAVFELALEVGANSPTGVRAHKGHITLKLTSADLPENTLEILTPWAKAIEKDLKVLAIRPGGGERYKFQIDVQMANKCAQQQIPAQVTVEQPHRDELQHDDNVNAGEFGNEISPLIKQILAFDYAGKPQNIEIAQYVSKSPFELMMALFPGRYEFFEFYEDPQDYNDIIGKFDAISLQEFDPNLLDEQVEGEIVTLTLYFQEKTYHWELGHDDHYEQFLIELCQLAESSSGAFVPFNAHPDYGIGYIFLPKALLPVYQKIMENWPWTKLLVTLLKNHDLTKFYDMSATIYSALGSNKSKLMFQQPLDDQGDCLLFLAVREGLTDAVYELLDRTEIDYTNKAEQDFFAVVKQHGNAETKALCDELFPGRNL